MLYQEDYSKRKRLRDQSPFLSYRKNVYNQRVENNVTKQFKEIHNSVKHEPAKVDTSYITDTITDAQGLENAYSHGDYYIHGSTMYIAGSHTGKDWYDDVTKVPAWGDVRNSTRYQAARDALLDNPQVHTTIGHSLGGSVALELEKNYNHITSSRTYGAPVFDPLGKESNNVSRYRNWTDPVSMFDRSAVKSIKWNPFESTSLTHDYGNIAKDFTSSVDKPVSSTNADGTASLIG